MTQIEALRQLEGLGVEAFSTRDAAALLRVTPANAQMILGRLAAKGFLVHLMRGRWALARTLRPLMLPEHLAAPWPAYVSLQTALFHHGLIEQVPAVVYAVTVGRTRRITTPAATVSLHHVPPKLFTGFEVIPEGAKMATPEKALFDLLYLAPARSRLFASLPEIEFPRGFRWRMLKGFLAEVGSSRRRAFILEALRRVNARAAAALLREVTS
jgi:predicted transcriptional regulator of viral defense system